MHLRVHVIQNHNAKPYKIFKKEGYSKYILNIRVNVTWMTHFSINIKKLIKFCKISSEMTNRLLFC